MCRGTAPMPALRSASRTARLPAGAAVRVDDHLMARPRLTASQRRALESLAASGPNGSTIDGMLASAFKLATIARLVRNGQPRSAGRLPPEKLQLVLP